MKKSFISLSIAAFLFAACSGNQNKEHDHNDGTHTHEDGSVHQNNEEDTAKQEEFTVPADTSSKMDESKKEHSHDGHEHPHKH
ncbi:MAG TPA: hypothetical protein VJY62_11060 [Bacteroidia bacterium]|nr:hypothetical protein [Bacteroidia bacterium]